MRKIYTICFALLLNLFATEFSHGQCVVVDSINSTYNFNDPSGTGTYTGFLCIGVDSLGTTGASGYYDGDGYRIKLVAGSEVTFSIDSCTGNPASLTVNDSSSNIIPGAYSGAACPNSLDFTATYTGTYIIVINKNGICGGGGSSLIGEVYVKIKTGTTVPDCPDAGTNNDTICGAITLNLDSVFVEGNTNLAFPSDPMDAYISSIGGNVCSPPNNTLWYSFTPAANIDTMNVVLTSEIGGNFHSWLVVFPANNINNPCTGNLSFLGCVEGPNDALGIDTVRIPVYGLIAGHTYFFMIDGYNGSTGKFSIRLESSGLINAINNIESQNEFSIYPNPAGNTIHFSSAISGEVQIEIFNSINQGILNRNFKNLSEAEINVGHLAIGTYVVKISSTKSIVRKKLIVTR